MLEGTRLMGVPARSRGRLAAAAFTATGLLATGALAVPSAATAASPAAATAATAAAALPPWNLAGPVSSTAYSAGYKELVVASDGSAVALWNAIVEGTTKRRLYAALRAPGSSTWGPAKLLAETPTDRGDVQLVAGTGNEVTAVWAESLRADVTQEGRLEARVMAATLNTATGVWTQPAEVLANADALRIDRLRLAAGPGGIFSAVWSGRTEPTDGGPWQTVSTVATATRGANGVWSKPAVVATSASAADSVTAADIVVDTAGVAVIAFRRHTDRDKLSSIETLSRPSVDGTWSAPTPLTVPAARTAKPNLGAGPDGTIAVTWTDEDAQAEGYEGTTLAVQGAVRRPESAGWSVPRQLGHALPAAHIDTPEPLVSPRGDVTIVWSESRYDGAKTTTALNSSTLAAGAAAWTPAANVARATDREIRGHHDAAIGPDGTVRVVWSQLWASAGPNAYAVTETARDPRTGTWTAPVRLSQVTGAETEEIGEVAVGKDGAGAAFWSGDNGYTPEQLFAARTSTEPPVALVSSTVPATVTVSNMTPVTIWDPVWNTNRPVRWTLTLKDTAGRVFRTIQGDLSQQIRPRWEGYTDKKYFAPNGPAGWELKATGAESPTAVVLGRGTVTMLGGSAVRRDFGSRAGTPDGTGDLMSTTSSGSLRIAYGHAGSGNFSGSVTTTGWPKGFLPVPIGGVVPGDRDNDLLVRMPSGELRRYNPNRAAKIVPTTNHTVLGKGWNAYDILTSPGDVTKDGRADLIARDPKTGALYLYATARSGSGGFAPKVSLGTSYKGFKKIVGAGDLNGDRIGDLLLQDASNELWRMYGKGDGTFGARILLAKDWGGSYNALVGVNDLTGDGRADLVARDTSGRIWRFNGTGKGTFGARAQLGTGWQVYSGLH
ncbi:FG-GAP repeat domain-containing protein [Streptomyces sp. NPDC002073]